MIDFMSSWTETIIIAIVISTIIEMILPNGNIKKYVRTVMGAFMIFVIISPIITKITGKEINLGDFIEMPKTDIDKQTEVINTNAYIEQTNKETIKKDIEENLKKKGYKVESIELEIETNEENFGIINKIVLKISKNIPEISEIETVEINIKKQEENKKKIESSEERSIKKFLSETYGTENIIIN